MKRLTIDVTQADIDAGKRCSLTKCPVALAARRAVPQAECVTVSTAIQFWPPVQEYQKAYLMPREVANFIALFDDGKTVQPFTFTIARAAP